MRVCVCACVRGQPVPAAKVFFLSVPICAFQNKQSCSEHVVHTRLDVDFLSPKKQCSTYKKATAEDGRMTTDDHRHSTAVTKQRASFTTAISIHIAHCRYIYI